MQKKHLGLEQMYQIQSYLQAGLSARRIASLLDVAPSTITRCLKKNGQGKFNPQAAMAARLRPKERGPYKFKGELRSSILIGLRNRRTPQEISGRLKEKGLPYVSHETIYQHIFKDKQQGGKLYEFLVRKRKERVSRSLQKRPRGKIKAGLSIEDRPAIINDNLEYGHYEVDTIVLRGQRGCIVTLVERKSRFCLTALLKDRTAPRVTEQIIRLLKQTKLPVKSITSDNGKEFANHEEITKRLNVQYYFCHPYSSWERGLNENTNGLLRRFIPKKTKFEDLTRDFVKWATQKVNDKYRKCLNYRSSTEVVRNFISSHTVASET